MKILRVATVYAVLSVSVLAQQKTDKDLEGLRGEVHIVRTTVSYELKKAERIVKKGRHSDDIHIYDRQGNLIEKHGRNQPIRSQSFFSNGANGERIEKRYPILRDSKGRLPRGVVPGGGNAGGEEEFMILITTYQFNADKQQLEATTRWQGGGARRQFDTYLFNKKGWLIEFASKDRADAAYGSRYRFVYEYDERGMVTELRSYKGDNVEQVSQYHDIVVDKQGNWIKRTEIVKDADGKPWDTVRISVRQITYY